MGSLHQHLPIRALNQKDRIIPHSFSPNPFNLGLTTGTQEIETNAVLVRFDQLIEARSQLGILSLRQVAFKDTVLHPLSIRLENLMNLGAPLIFRNVIGNGDVHEQSYEF
jgi:hypothetical protein